MKKIRIIVLFVYCFCFTGCRVSFTPKREPRFKQQVVSKFITNDYNPSLDILFIVDDSGSMAFAQKLLAKNANLFIGEFLEVEAIDYHIAVTSSSFAKRPHNGGNYIDEKTLEEIIKPVYGGRLVRCDDLAETLGYDYSNYVDRGTPKADQCFSEMMNVGTRGNDFEHFFDIPTLVFSKSMLQDRHSSFYRPEAHLAVFIITSAYDNSDFTSKEAYDFLLKLKEGHVGKIHYAAGVIISEVHEYGCKKEPPYYESPPKIMELVKLFGPRGYLFNLCRFNYGKNLSEFASHLVDFVLTFSLDYPPDLNSLEVHYHHKGGIQVVPKGPDGWIYDVKNNAIHLSRDIQLDGIGGKFNIKYELFHVSEI